MTDEDFKFLVCENCYDRPEFHMVCDTAINVKTGKEINLKTGKEINLKTGKEINLGVLS